jgi:hypothetical protein
MEIESYLKAQLIASGVDLEKIIEVESESISSLKRYECDQD